MLRRRSDVGGTRPRRRRRTIRAAAATDGHLTTCVLFPGLLPAAPALRWEGWLDDGRHGRGGGLLGGAAFLLSRV